MMSTINPPYHSDDDIWFRDVTVAPQDTVAGFNDIVAVLKQLAKGRYPRADIVPTALHAYNRSQPEPMGLYIHPVTPIEFREKDKTWKGFGRVPILRLPEAVLAELEARRAWIPLDERRRAAFKMEYEQARAQGRARVSWEQLVANKAHYRFLCFVHEHRLTLATGAQRHVFTVSIYDREKNEVFWHDMWGPAERRERRALIMEFWKCVKFYGPWPSTPPRMPPGKGEENNQQQPPEEESPPIAKPRSLHLQPPWRFEKERWTEFRRDVQYLTSYHTARHMESMLRGPLNPRHSLYAVIGAVMHYIDQGVAKNLDPETVPDKPGLFAGYDVQFLPRLFTHLLLGCLDGGGLPAAAAAAAADKGKGKGKAVASADDREAFLQQFRFPKNAEWMSYGTRKNLARRFGDTEEARRIREALRIPLPPTNQREFP